MIILLNFLYSSNDATKVLNGVSFEMVDAPPESTSKSVGLEKLLNIDSPSEVENQQFKVKYWGRHSDHLIYL